MLKWLAVSTGVELGRLVLEQMLDLGKPVLEGYVQDFFRNCLDGGVKRLNAAALKTPMAEAIGFFIKRFIKELQFNEVPETSIEHHYKAAIKRFVQEKAVCSILGKAFEKGCKQIDYTQLEQIWSQKYQEAGWQFPGEEFDWRGVAKEYIVEVKGIIKANAELRALLETELLEDIARNTAQISPGFDIAKYRESLQCSYGYLKLYTLDSTDRTDAIKLWTMFIEQTVREALPPMRYELPTDLKCKLQAEGQLEDDLPPEALEHYRREYFQQPLCKVLEAVANAQKAVILGDPGAGKSTLLQYLALEWVENNTPELPLLIELRDYAAAQSASFLEFLHHGRGADWQFDQQQLHQHLLENVSLVMFDGLDEVFDRPTQSAVIDDIIRFAQQYPKARVLVTSRIIGYSPERFQHAGFRQFTIQPLNEAETHEFIDRWYNLSMGSDPDKIRLKQRLKDAIANFRAIQNLAENPLLLTMMAILNRRQELPRDRADLYDQASRVLLYHWDVDHKRLNLPLEAIGRREKQEILRLIAYEMQASEEGLKGNLISADRLTRILTHYLHDQGFNEPREKANQLMQQLRERNFILCYRGADTYGFVHRTFLEYFCAMEIVNRFEKQRILNLEQLQHKIFGQHWQKETWREVLRLICGMVDEKVAGSLLEFLLKRESEAEDFRNLILASNCLSEVRNQTIVKTVAQKIIKSLRILASRMANPENIPLKTNTLASYRLVILTLAEISSHKLDFLDFLKLHIQSRKVGYHPDPVMEVIGRNFKEDSSVLAWLKNQVESAQEWAIKSAVIQGLAMGWRTDPDTLPLLCSCLKSESESRWLKRVSAYMLGQFFQNEQAVLSLLKRCLQSKDYVLRGAAIGSIARHYRDDPETFPLIKLFLQSDENEWVRAIVIHELTESEWRQKPEVFELFCRAIQNDPFIKKDGYADNPRQIAMNNLLTYYSTHPKTIDLLRDRATNDPDELLREWAQKELQQLKTDNEEA